MKKLLIAVLTVSLLISAGILFASAEADGTLVSEGVKYTFTGQHTDGGTVQYEDVDGVQLTDGILGDEDSTLTYQNVNWVGIAATDGVANVNTVTLDFESVENDLTAFLINFYVQASPGIKGLNGLKIEISDDGTTFTNVPVITETEQVVAGTEEGDGIFNVIATAGEKVNARYVKFSITHAGAWFFMGEVQVYANGTTVEISEPEPVSTPAADSSAATSSAASSTVSSSADSTTESSKADEDGSKTALYIGIAVAAVVVVGVVVFVIIKKKK